MYQINAVISYIQLPYPTCELPYHRDGTEMCHKYKARYTENKREENVQHLVMPSGLCG
jgi:hypothetical protein